MKETTLALLHTTPLTVPLFKELCAELLPGVRTINLLDDSLLPDINAALARGESSAPAAVRERLALYLEAASRAGADALMCCCSSIGEIVMELASTAPLPVWRIDEAMAAQAVAAAGPGGRIGVLATLRSTLEPTSALLRRKAGSAATIQSMVAAGAFEALQAGRPEEHDALVTAALQSLLSSCNVVVLAQASMARLLGSLQNPPPIPILTSPRLGVQMVHERLQALSCQPSTR
jgi:Asp/Glu/hydantoin racemase